jgi:hypothetical protein
MTQPRARSRRRSKKKPRKPLAPTAPHPALFNDHDHDQRPPWEWEPCVYCHGQGWTTPPPWLLAWTHPAYPNMEAVGEALRAQGVPVDFRTLPVRERCSDCNGTGRRYIAPRAL